jgi:hypothetical protein
VAKNHKQKKLVSDYQPEPVFTGSGDYWDIIFYQGLIV